MNRSLETEYKNLVRTELPDLWGKIEEKLDAQEAAAQTNVTVFPKTVTMSQNDQIDKSDKIEKKEKLEKIFSDLPDTGDTVKIAAPQKKKKRNIPWQYFGVAAAAVLCVLVVIPVMSSMRSSGTTMAPAAAGSTQATAESAPASADMGADPVESVDMAAETAEAEEEPASGNMNAVTISDSIENIREQHKTENGNASYSVAPASQTAGVSMSEGEAQSQSAGSEAPASAAETANAEDAVESEETLTVPAAACEERKAVFLLSTVGDDIPEKQLSQMLTQLQKDMDPNLSLVLQEADETEYVDARAGHCTHVLILAGTMTEKQRKDEVDRILQELQNYSFVSIRDVAYPED